MCICGKAVRVQQGAHFVLQTVSSLGITFELRKHRACWGGELVRATIPDGPTGLFLLFLCQRNTFRFLIRKKIPILTPTSPAVFNHLNTHSSGKSPLTAPPLHVLSTLSLLPREHFPMSSRWMAIVQVSVPPKTRSLSTEVLTLCL